MRRLIVRTALPVVGLGLLMTACGNTPTASQELAVRTAPEPAAAGDSILDSVTAADTIKCGVRNDLPGFSSTNEAGDHVGFDADFCRVLAAGILGDSTKVTFVDVETDARFTALQSGEIDVLVRNTTWTASRDGTEGVDVPAPDVLRRPGDDGRRRFRLRVDRRHGRGDDLRRRRHHDRGQRRPPSSPRRGLTANVQSFDSVDLLQEAFIAGRCDGWSSDNSQLNALRSAYPDGPDALTIFPDIFSKEPLAPAVVDGDSRWAQAVDWSIFATIQAEEYGLTKDNVDDGLTSDDPNVVTFLGGANADGTVLDPGLGLSPDFAYNIVSQVGNYGEIFETNLAPIGIERGVNALWTDGGLQYAPPYR